MVCTLSLSRGLNTDYVIVYIGEQSTSTPNPERPNPVYDPDVLVDEEITGT
jgi:hypothetical protein